MTHDKESIIEAFESLVSSMMKPNNELTKRAWERIDFIKSALQLAQEAEQVRKRLAELENLLTQANKTIQWYERTEATND